MSSMHPPVSIYGDSVLAGTAMEEFTEEIQRTKPLGCQPSALHVAAREEELQGTAEPGYSCG